MRIDTHSVLYFINEEYGVVIRARGANKEVSMWEAKRQGFTKRLDLLTASFLVRTDRVGGRWCPAHPTYRLSTAIKAAAKLTAALPNADGMKLAREAKMRQMRAELHEKGGVEMARELCRQWHEREARYVGM